MPTSTEPYFPKLASKMAEKGHNAYHLAVYLEISADTVRKSLRGARQFALPEILGLMELYDSTFEELFPSIINSI